MGYFGLLCSGVYRVGLAINQYLQRRSLVSAEALPDDLPVIAIGNLTTGGTGKTPVTIALAQYFEMQGHRPLVLSRGYKASAPVNCEPVSLAAQGDEAFLIQSQLAFGHVWTAKNRATCLPKAISACRPSVVLLDDAFQSLSTPRTWNIVLVDGERGFGNGHLLPAGPLREPLGALTRANVIALTRCENAVLRAQIQQVLDANDIKCPIAVIELTPSALFNPRTSERCALRSIDATPVVLISGLAQPKRFETQVAEATGATIGDHHVYDDHCVYTEVLLASWLEEQAREPDMVFVTTRKDWVKIDALAGSDALRCLVFDITATADWAALLP